MQSETNAGIQIADLVAYTVAWMETHRGSQRQGDVALLELFRTLIGPHLRTWRTGWP